MTALRPIKKKIQSERGASITFALLLFLVCAVLSSVLITAGTAAAGRMSQIAETDQRFYAVTSAAELMKGLLDGKSVTFVEKDGDLYLFDKEYEEIEPEDYTSNNQVEGNGANGDLLLNSTLNRISYHCFKGTNYTPRVLTLKSSDIENFPVVTAEESFTPGPPPVDESDKRRTGTFTLKLYNAFDADGETESTAANQYSLTLTFYLEKIDLSPAGKVVWSLKSMKANS